MFRIGGIEKDRYVLMKQYQTFIEFWIRKDGTLTCRFSISFHELPIEEQIIAQLTMHNFYKEKDHLMFAPNI
ncbi:MAG: hypothetical protein RSB44_00170 [Carnobacterium sp.]